MFSISIRWMICSMFSYFLHVQPSLQLWVEAKYDCSSSFYHSSEGEKLMWHCGLFRWALSRPTSELCCVMDSNSWKFREYSRHLQLTETKVPKTTQWTSLYILTIIIYRLCFYIICIALIRMRYNWIVFFVLFF